MQWEYSLIDMTNKEPNPFLTELNALGNDGWELAVLVKLVHNIPTAQESTYAIFKRVKV